MIKKIYVLVVLLVLTHFVSAQNTKGTIFDDSTKEAIPFVSVTLLSDKSQCYIGNVNGEFFINDSFAPSDTVVFSCMGYGTEFVSVGDIRKNNMKVFLKGKSIELPEIVVLDAKTILKEAWDNIPKNYPEEYPLLKGKYRKQVAENDRLTFIGECDMLTKPYSLKEHSKNKRPKLSFSDKKIFEADSVLISMQMEVEPSFYPYFYMINPKRYEEFSYKRVQSNEEGIYKIEFYSNDGDEKGFVCISVDNWAVMSIHVESKLKNKDLKVPFRGKVGEWHDISMVNDYFWEEIDSKYQPSYVRSFYSSYISGNEKSKKLKNSTVKSSTLVDYFITERGGDSKAKFKKIEDPFKNTKDAEKCESSNFTLIPTDFTYE